MTDVIKIVADDAYPDIALTLTDETSGLPVDLSASTTNVFAKFRARGSTNLISTIVCTKTDAANGVVEFNFLDGTLDGLSAGEYEAEIEINYDGETHTVFDPLKFRLREGF